MKLKQINKILGPGLIYAATAVGVSHLVQSTRAGAKFGLTLIWAIVLCHFIKYPFFKIAPTYTHATGKTLLQGYKELGSWSIPLFFVMTLLTMFIIQAAVTIVTAGISLNIFNSELSPEVFGCFLLIFIGLILQTNKYQWLEHIVKFIILVLTITTLISVAMALFDDTLISRKSLGQDFSFYKKKDLLFLVAFIGWMPAPMDVPIWHSLWTKAQQKAENKTATAKEANLDFSIGYFGTAFLALGFLSLGALVMHGKESGFSTGAVGFASQLIKLYTHALGEWAYPLIAIASFVTMLSTTLTCLDAFPRILAEASKLQYFTKISENQAYRLWLTVTIIGTSSLLLFFTNNMKAMVDFATTVSFTIAPIYAYLNYKVINHPSTPEFLKYRGKMKYYPLSCLVIMALFSLYYLKVQFLG